MPPRAQGVEGRTIDIGSGVLTSVREIVKLIVEEVGPTVGRPLFGMVPVRPLERKVEVDTRQAKRLLGWQPTTTLDDGLNATVAWYRGERKAERLRVVELE